MTEEKAKVVDEKPEINKKLGNVKFEQVFDSTAIQKAEQVFDKKKDDFADSVKENFDELKAIFDGIEDGQVPSEDIVKDISNIVFEIKSKGTTGGFPLITSVAKSLYEYCDQYANKVNESQFKVIKIHFNALSQIFSNQLDANNEEKANKLLAGLQELTQPKE